MRSLCYFSLRDEMPLAISEQGGSIICFEGKFEFLNSDREMLIKSLHCASLSLSFPPPAHGLCISAVL